MIYKINEIDTFSHLYGVGERGTCISVSQAYIVCSGSWSAIGRTVYTGGHRYLQVHSRCIDVHLALCATLGRGIGFAVA